jgi:hypothetical protein
VKLLVVAIVLAVFAPLALATDLTVRCTPSTKNTDSTPFATGSTPGFNLYGAYQGQPLVLLNPTPSPSCLFMRGNVNPGAIVYAVTQLTLLNGIAGPESAQTAPITTVVPPPPAPPGGLTVTLVTTSTIAYGLAPAHDRLAFLIVGSVPLGAACLPDQTANLYRVVPVASVTFTAPYKAATVPTVFALCNG